MDRRVTLQSAAITRDAVNCPVQTWSDVATVWASIRDLRAKETFAAEQAGSSVSKIVGIRYRSGVSADMRIVLPGTIVGRIAGITEIGRREKLELQVEVVDV